MWKVDPKVLCAQHLLGEHVEMHMFVGTIIKGKNISGFIDRGLVEVHNITRRHEHLADEMKKRGFNHKSPLPIFTAMRGGKIDVKNNLTELARRCPACRERILQSPLAKAGAY
jgi:hypothetical protein